MEGFTQPPAQGGGKIAPAVPLAKTDEERQKAYAGLAAIREKEITAAPTAKMEMPEEPAPAAAPAENSPPSLATPTTEDKQQFVRSILGEKQYGKEYKLFDGQVRVRLLDRTMEETEAMYTWLNSQVDQKKIKDDDEWQLQYERYCLASTLTALFLATKAVTGIEGKSPLEKMELVAKLPKPLYRALMALSRVFEEHVDILTGKAQEQGFWKTGGGA